MLYYDVLYYAILCYTILYYYAMIYYTILDIPTLWHLCQAGLPAHAMVPAALHLTMGASMLYYSL